MSFSLHRALGATLLSVLFAGSAQAHVSLEWPAAMAGTTYKASFRISHGCGASPTRQVTVEIPPGVRGARPMPHPGWRLEVQRAALAKPYVNHGRTVTEDVVRVTWTARSADDMLDGAHFDEFVLMAQLPETPGTLYWPVRQACAEGRLDWVQQPAPGQAAGALAAPAVPLEVLPSQGGGGHSH